MNLDLRYYLSVFLRRFPLFLVVAGLIGGIGIGAALTLPPAYVSHTQLIIEPPQIPEGMAGPTVEISPQEQLELFQTRLLTRANMLAIARKLDVLEGQREMTPDQIIEGMRSRTQVQRQAGRNRATSMTLAFEAREPQIAAAVLNEYLTLILQSDASNRTGRASQTQDFFSQEVQRLGDELNLQSTRILEFKTDNADALPESLDYLRSQQLAQQERITDASRELSALRDQRQRLVEIFESTGQIAVTNEDLRSPEQQDVDRLRRELSDALLVYSEQNPRVQLLQRRLAQLEEQLAEQTAGEPEAPESPAQAMYNLQLAEIDTRIEALEQQVADLTERLATIDDSIARIPANALALTAMERDYDNLQAQYDTAVNRQAQASTGERIALLARGERVTVVEQPSVPSAPSKPDRPKIAGAGVVLGSAAGIGLIALIEFLNGTARRPADLVARLNITPIATIPYLRTRREIITRRMTKVAMALLVLIAIPSVLAAVHYYYLPLDLLADRVMSKFGLRG